MTIYKYTLNHCSSYNGIRINFLFKLCVVECERGISSIELQLVRIETCGSTEINTKEGKEYVISMN